MTIVYLFKTISGDILASRHVQPDFVYGLSEDEIMANFPEIKVIMGKQAKKYLGG